MENLFKWPAQSKNLYLFKKKDTTENMPDIPFFKFLYFKNFLSVNIFILVAVKQKKNQKNLTSCSHKMSHWEIFTYYFGMQELLGILVGVLKNSSASFSVKQCVCCVYTVSFRVFWGG